MKSYVIAFYLRDCSVALSLKETDDDKGLQVTRFHEDHNHEIIQLATYIDAKFLP